MTSKSSSARSLMGAALFGSSLSLSMLVVVMKNKDEEQHLRNKIWGAN